MSSLFAFRTKTVNPTPVHPGRSKDQKFQKFRPKFEGGDIYIYIYIYIWIYVYMVIYMCKYIYYLYVVELKAGPR